MPASVPERVNPLAVIAFATPTAEVAKVNFAPLVTSDRSSPATRLAAASAAVPLAWATVVASYSRSTPVSPVTAIDRAVIVALSVVGWASA